MDAETTEQPVAGGREIAWLKGRVKELQERVAVLERDSHASVDLRPAVTSIVAELVGAGAACVRHGALFCGPCAVMDAPRCRHGGLWKMCSLCYPPESGAEDSPSEKAERHSEPNPR